MNALLQPAPFFAALKLLAQKNLVPTELDTEQLRQIDASIRRQALFSARMTQLQALQSLSDALNAMLEGTGNLADAKLTLLDSLRELGYDVGQGGFPQDKPGLVPSARKGSLRDLASDKRLTLTITTNYRMAANQVYVTRGLEPRRLKQWPAWELVRIGRVRTPRGFKRGAMEPLPGDDWPSRFVAAGGELFDKGTRMIALKTSDVWQRLGDGAGGHKDTLGNPFAPFAFGSKYGVREVPREECLTLGVLVEGDAGETKLSTEDALREFVYRGLMPKSEWSKGKIRIAPVTSKATAGGVDPKLISAMKRDLFKDDDGLLKLRQAEQAQARAAYGNRSAETPLRNRLGMLCGLINARSARVRTAMRTPVDRSAAAKKGWVTRRAHGWRPSPRPGRAAVQRMKTEARTGASSLGSALSRQRDVPEGMTTPKLGKIDFTWGRPGNPAANEHGVTYADGYGISHIHAKRGMEAIRRLPVVLARGRVLPHEEPDRRIVQYAGWSAIVKEHGKGRWEVRSLIDDLVVANPKKKGMRGGEADMKHKPLLKRLKNKAARLSLGEAGPTTKMDAGEEHPGPTHAAQRFAKDGVVASKDSRLHGLRARCKALVVALQRNGELRTANGEPVLA